MRWVYDFSEGSREMRDLLGGKGANVAEMTPSRSPSPADDARPIPRALAASHIDSLIEIPVSRARVRPMRRRRSLRVPVLVIAAVAALLVFASGAAAAETWTGEIGTLSFRQGA